MAIAWYFIMWYAQCVMMDLQISPLFFIRNSFQGWGLFLVLYEVVMDCKTCLGCNKQEDSINIHKCVNCVSDSQLEAIEAQMKREIVEQRKKIFEVWKRK